MSTTVDYIIVGHGLAGSTLAWQLLLRGKRVIVFDEPVRNRASGISAGICNPITGRVMTKTYLAEELFPYLKHFYSEAEKKLGSRFFFPLPVYRPFISPGEAQRWKEKADTSGLRPFVAQVRQEPLSPESLNNPYGGLEIALSGYLDVKGWIAAMQGVLISKQAYREEQFVESDLQVENEIRYRELTASAIIFCNGLSAKQSRWFDWLPLVPLKGETLTVKMNFERSRIISRGVFVVPGKEAGEFVTGSTYQHPPFTDESSESGLAHITSKLREIIREPFKVIHQDWGIRPTVTDRRPLLGHHLKCRNVLIFNGLGTKGVSLAPYFAQCLANWLDGVSGLPEEVNIWRFKSLYSG